MALDTKKIQEKIILFLKRITLILREQILILILAVLLLTIFLDAFIYYKYVYLAEKEIPEVSVKAAKIPTQKFKAVLKDIDRRAENFEKISTQPTEVKNIFE